MKLYSKIYGEKSCDLIIIHGLFGMSDNWNSLGKKFAKYFRVHILDLRNHGRSPHSDIFNYDLMCSDMLEYLQDHQINHPILLGHSLGGKVAMKFAFTYPNKIAKMIIVDIAPRKYNTDFHSNILRKLSELELRNFTKRSEIDLALSISIEDIGIRSFLLKNLFRNDNKQFSWRFNIKALLDQLDNIQDNSFVDGFCDVSTCFIKGEKSNYITIEDERLLSKNFTKYNVVSVENSGHWVHAENPEGFYNEVLNFCLTL